MRRGTLILTVIAGVTLTIGLLAVNGHAGKREAETRGQIGPDVVAWCIGGQGGFDFDYYGSSGGVGGYSMATVSCNYGDQEANWYGGTDQSPVISQNAFRLKDGRFEQIGMQCFMKHSFCALSEPGCGSCQSTNCDTLGIGCADTYWAGLNSNGTAPRSDVNAYTGEYAYPFTHSPSGPSSIRGNLQIDNDDVEPSSNPGARYFIEGQYLTEDDATWGNQMNNASWREIGFNSVSSPYAIGSGPSATNVGEPAILAWASIDPSVEITEAMAPEDGMIIVGAKVFDNGDGTYDYEYAIHNLNCHRSIGSVDIPTGSASISSVGFKDINYNSGEIYDGTDWTNSVVPGTVSWNTETYDQNPNGNALRWGTMYNYRFTATSAPQAGNIELGLFKPGGPDSFVVMSVVPADPADPCDEPLGTCPEDVDDDGSVAVSDILAIVGNWGVCGDGTFRPLGDVDGDCCVTVNDLLQVIGAWGADCVEVGACCLPTGSCNDASTEFACLTAGGDYQGKASVCADVNCPAPGACCFYDGSCSDLMSADCTDASGDFQGEGSSCFIVDCPVTGNGDECAVAMIAVYGQNPFETNTATPSSPEPDESQYPGTYLEWENSQDVWFLWVANQTGSVNFTTCDSSSYDTSLVLYENSCETQVACNGDGDGQSNCQPYYSSLDYDVTEGETYYIRLGGWLGATGQGTLLIGH